jgi:hypothetical protein
MEKVRSKKNYWIFSGMVAVIMVGFMVWYKYDVSVTEREVSPLKLPGIISGECGIEQCHGLDITCGPKVPDACTMEARTDDICRQYISCERISGDCRVAMKSGFEKCRDCIEGCNQIDDGAEAFGCAQACAEDIDSLDYTEGSIIVVFKPNTYDQAIELMEGNGLGYQMVSSEKQRDVTMYFAVEVPKGTEREWINRFEGEEIVLEADFDWINKSG